MKVFESIEQIYAEAGKNSQVTAQAVINRRLYVSPGGWQPIELTDKCEDEFIESVLNILGGWTKNQPRMARVLRSIPQHWSLGRILLAKHGDSPARFSYCAGQDYPSELRQIRQYLTKR